MHEESAQSCDETVGCLEPGRPLSGSIQDQELLLDENGLRDHGADAARAHKSGKGGDDMDEKNDEIAHRSIVARSANTRNCGANWEFAIDRFKPGRWLHENKRLPDFQDPHFPSRNAPFAFCLDFSCPSILLTLVSSVS